MSLVGRVVTSEARLLIETVFEYHWFGLRLGTWWSHQSFICAHLGERGETAVAVKICWDFN